MLSMSMQLSSSVQISNTISHCPQYIRISHAYQNKRSDFWFGKCSRHIQNTTQNPHSKCF